MVYTFSQNDQMAADDEFRFNINLTEDFVDVVADTAHNPLAHLQNRWNTTKNRCSTPELSTSSNPKRINPVRRLHLLRSVYWQLWDADDTMMLKEAYKTVANLCLGWNRSVQHQSASVQLRSRGAYLLKYGLFSSTGNPTATSTQATTSLRLKSCSTTALTSRWSMSIRATALNPRSFTTEPTAITTYANLGTCQENISVSYQVYNSQYDPGGRQHMPDSRHASGYRHLQLQHDHDRERSPHPSSDANHLPKRRRCSMSDNLYQLSVDVRRPHQPLRPDQL